MEPAAPVPQTRRKADPAAKVGAKMLRTNAADRATAGSGDGVAGVLASSDVSRDGGRPGDRARPTTGGPILSTRVTAEEMLAFDAALAAAGYRSRSEALRALLRGAGGAVSVTAAEAELLGTLAHELHKVGVNVNQIALAANRRQISLVMSQWEELRALRQLLPELRLGIGRLVALRRKAGQTALGAGSGGGQAGAAPPDSGPFGGHADG